ncbi:MAG TPA: hypothetical protein VL793_10815 [Patescibacteria group bacterium]|nr:hypothetical protein [Patescibacteria group bacterium]
MAACLAAVPALEAQDTNLVSQTNELMQAEDSAGADMSQLTEDEAMGTNVVAETNQVDTPGTDGRTRRRRRLQSRPKEAATARDPRTGPNDTNASPSSLDYSAFRLIVDRNIFDPNRAPRSGRPSAQPRTTDSFTLVGTMSYEKGIFAFFDGTSSDYKKAVKPEETIAGYKVTAISADAVKLARGTNVVDLSVGTQMRRRDDGTWEKSAKVESYASAASNSTTTTQSAPTGAESDVLKKMMMRREKE